MDNILRF